MKKIAPINALFAVAAAALLLVLSSCGGAPEHLKTIPATTGAVISFNPSSIALKGDLSSFKDSRIMSTLRTELETAEPEAAKQMEELMSNPLSTGLSLLDDVYMFHHAEGEREQYMVLTAGVSSEEKFKTWIEQVMTLGSQEYDLDPKDGFTQLLIPNSEYSQNPVMGWNSDKLVLVMPMVRSYSEPLDEKLESALANIMNVSKEASVLSNSDFNSFYENRQDLSVWVSGNVLDKIPEAAAEVEKSLGFTLPGNYLHYHTAFNDGELAMDMDWTLTDAAKKVMMRDGMMREPDTKVLAYHSGTPVAAIAFGTNLMQAYKAAMESMSRTEPGLADQAKQVDGMVKMQTTYGLDEILSAFDGDFALTFSDLTVEEVTVTREEPVWVDDPTEYYGGRYEYQEVEVTETKPQPKATLTATFNNQEFYDKLIALIPDPMKSAKGTVTELNLGEVTAFAALNNGLLVITTNGDVANSLKSGETPNPLASSDVGSFLASEPSALYLNLDLSTYPEGLSEQANRLAGETNPVVFETITSKLKALEYSGSATHSGLRLKLNSDENFLKVVLTTAEELYPTLMAAS